ncbi:MAG: hypothetical protein CMJ18_06630 [Phycisphaeraceae bacterium]|nr:hypothetical protein [Phycisphaeraceae bacterium]
MKIRLLIFSACAACATVTVGAENLVVNPRFDDGLAGWQTHSNAAGNVSILTERDTVGQPALRIRAREIGASVSQKLGPLKQSGYYRLSARVRVFGTRGDVRIGVGYGHEDGPTLCVSDHVVGANRNVLKLSAMCYTGAKFRHELPVRIHMELNGRGDVVFDDVAFTFVERPSGSRSVNRNVSVHDYGNGWSVLEIQGPDGTAEYPVTRLPQVHRDEPTPTEFEREHSLMTFVPGDREGVMPDYRPSDRERASRVTCFASPGEYELTTFVIRPLRDLGKMNFEIGDFSSSVGASFSGSEADLYVGDVTVEQAGLRRSETTRFVRRVKWLRPATGARGKAGENVQLFIDVRVPDDAPPGTYTAPVTIRRERGSESRFEVHVEVLDLALDRARNWGAFVYGWHGMPHRREDALLKLRELRRHGMTQCVISPLFVQNRPGYESGKARAPDFGFYDECLALYQEAGFPDPAVLALEGWLFSMTESLDRELLTQYGFAGRRLIGVLPDALPESYRALVHHNLRRLYDHGLEQSLPPFYAYLADEPWSRAKTRIGALLMYPTARQAAGSLMTATSLYESMGPFEERIDLNFMHYVHPCRSAEAAAAARQEAERLDTTVLGMAWSMAVEDTFFDHGRLIGFMSEKCGLKGMMPWVQWVIGRVEDLGRPVDPFRDLHITFKGGPWTRVDRAGRAARSLNLLGYREAIDDSRYVNTARTLAQRARASFDRDVRRKGEMALRRIDALLESVPYKEVYDEDEGSWNDAAATRTRRRIAMMAVDLQASVGIDVFRRELNASPSRRATAAPLETP